LKKTLLSAVIFLLICSFIVPVALAGAAYGPDLYFSCYGYNYCGFTLISTPSSGTSCGASEGIMLRGSGTVPSGYMGALARAYDQATGNLVGSSSWLYTSKATYSHTNYFGFTGTKGKSYYSYGAVQTYNGSGYTTYYPTRSPAQSVV